ncbi:MAG: glycosyltransferase [Candidatus Scalindua sp.]|nr:glycosyltransferase [Candidatus Scalindua sp.]
MSDKKVNILIVDDNMDHQILMQEALLKLIDEVNVVFAGTGEECLLQLSKENYDAIVIDFNLSDMNGLEVLRRMNDNEWNIPAMMVTAFGDENIAVDEMKLGAVDYIVKSDGYLNRLSSIVLRMIQEPKLKKEKEKVESDLRASELKYKILIDNARNFDVVFVAHKPSVEMFKEKGVENVFWVPPACDPEIHGKKTDEKLYDIGFVGTLNPEFNSQRVHRFNELKQRFHTYYERCFLERMAEVLSQSKIVFHDSVSNGLAMRVFEVMASGSMVLADEAIGSGLTDLFQDRKHIVIYKDEKELIELAGYYINNDKEREGISAEGMKKVLNEHTYLHRAKDMVSTLSLFKK